MGHFVPDIYICSVRLGGKKGFCERESILLLSLCLSNDPGKVDSTFFCYAATVLSPHRDVLIFTQRMHKPT